MPVPMPELMALLTGFWWPFCRFAATFAAAPILGDVLIPVRSRILVCAILAVVALPSGLAMPQTDPLSLAGVALALEQVVIGLIFGMLFYFVHGALLLAGFMVSSQMGLSMAVMNDPGNGTSSDVITQFFFLFSALMFFALNGHLVVTNVVYHSFTFWPIGGGLPTDSLGRLAGCVAWMLSAALLLSIPVIFSTFVVQLGFGLLNRVAPTLNLFSLGFPLVTLFGLAALATVFHTLPDHYVRLTGQILDMLAIRLAGAPHG
ncbi:flagellar biosynthetic protein FliR [Paludibacterium paludis]|uniref:Flagellar biosynthetic protein FliR n=1 Tax=Paludibacterium paludis TaxID=1225769 RepID=A0A918NXC6_9NEIS|nr:flagellar biosynthetic protein FliR [Paludibacterium paludis]GGY04546.1 flagellar biosynthetic protein FliR [Paludibacterium paludis]